MKKAAAAYPKPPSPLIARYLNCIPLGSEELYEAIYMHRLSRDQMQRNGFPLPDPDDPGKVTIISNRQQFPKQLDPEKADCRCGKTVSIKNDNWYKVDPNVGYCRYHPGKPAALVDKRGRQRSLYTCCGQCKHDPGCSRAKHHVSFHRPFEEIEFMRVGTMPPDPKHAHDRHPRNVFALDCEMAFTTQGMELVKVSLIGIDGSVVYDTYVVPAHEILDYNTPFSGVDEGTLRGVTTTIKDVQRQLVNLLNADSILIGHSVENDFLALNFIHHNVVDTSYVFPHESGYPMKNSLKLLAELHLKKNIQGGCKGHSSIEDARTCMELILFKIYEDTRRASMTWMLHDAARSIGFFRSVPPPFLPFYQPSPPFYPPSKGHLAFFRGQALYAPAFPPGVYFPGGMYYRFG